MRCITTERLFLDNYKPRLHVLTPITIYCAVRAVRDDDRNNW